MKHLVNIAATAVVAIGVLSGQAAAQTERVEAVRDWSIFEASADGNKICWIVSQPTQKTASRDGKVVEVQRGDVFLMVAIRPADGVKNEVSFIAGYPFKEGSGVRANIDGTNRFDMFTEGENAWSQSADDDEKIVAAFRRGIRTELRGVSARGTETVDTFSLSGFTKALSSARARCSG
ncbi:MAG: invasion associated locus B family protein [Pseudomonadota bacterium]